MVDESNASDTLGTTLQLQWRAAAMATSTPPPLSNGLDVYLVDIQFAAIKISFGDKFINYTHGVLLPSCAATAISL